MVLPVSALPHPANAILPTSSCHHFFYKIHFFIFPYFHNFFTRAYGLCHGVSVNRHVTDHCLCVHSIFFFLSISLSPIHLSCSLSPLSKSRVHSVLTLAILASLSLSLAFLSFHCIFLPSVLVRFLAPYASGVMGVLRMGKCRAPMRCGVLLPYLRLYLWPIYMGHDALCALIPLRVTEMETSLLTDCVAPRHPTSCDPIKAVFVFHLVYIFARCFSVDSGELSQLTFNGLEGEGK